MTRVGGCIFVLMKRYAGGLKQSWLRRYWHLKRYKGRLTALFHSWLSASYIENWILYCIQDVRICGATRQVRQEIPALFEWTWGNVETLHWSKGVEREEFGKMCSSYTGRWSISVIMILPEKSGQFEWRCKTDVGSVTSCHLYCSFYLLINGEKCILSIY